MLARLKKIIKRVPILNTLLRRIRYYISYKKYTKVFDIYSLSQYCERFTPETITLSTTGDSIVATIKDFRDLKQNIINHKLPPINIIKLQNASIIGNSDIVLTSSNVALYTGTVGKNENILEPILGTGLKQYYTIGPSTKIVIREVSDKVIPKAISLVHANDSKNYYHFIFDSLSKFWAIHEANIDIDIPIIIHKGSYDIPQFRTLLEYFNIEKRPIITVDKFEKVRVQKLYVIPSLSLREGTPRNWSNLTGEFPAYNPVVLDYMRNTGLKVIDNMRNTDTQLHKKIYISRKKCSLRSFNEDEIWSILKEHGFELIYPEDMSIQQQITTFYNADYIIGGSGAAFANLMFCHKGAKILILYNDLIKLPIFSSISYRYDCPQIYIAADKVKFKGEYHSPFHINPEELKNALNYLENI